MATKKTTKKPAKKAKTSTKKVPAKKPKTAKKPAKKVSKKPAALSGKTAKKPGKKASKKPVVKGVAVKAGQVWRSNDPRSTSTSIKVEKVTSHPFKGRVAVCVSTLKKGGARKTTIAINRFGVAWTSGYTLVSQA
jgi:hypothetical protein